MPAVRVRSEFCTRCYGKREVWLNLDDQSVMKASVPPDCTAPALCIAKVRDQAKLAPFEDGKTRAGR